MSWRGKSCFAYRPRPLTVGLDRHTEQGRWGAKASAPNVVGTASSAYAFGWVFVSRYRPLRGHNRVKGRAEVYMPYRNTRCQRAAQLA
ncbi:hypothetical protein BDW02DRAFT_567755, partial [Decorospora gaudefroyi]